MGLEENPSDSDLIGDPLPEGYKAWSCNICSAVCNFEAMMFCANRNDPKAKCGFEIDRPESNFGHFGFMKKIDASSDSGTSRS